MNMISNWTDMGVLERKEKREQEISEIKRKFLNGKLIMPEDKIVEFLDVAWQEDRNSKGNPIGYILVNNPNSQNEREFIFAYSKLGLEIARRKGFRNLVSFPDTEAIYYSKKTIFPTFLTKLPQKAREDLRGIELNETDLLIRFSGVITDDFILVPANYYGRANSYVNTNIILQNLGTIETNNKEKPVKFSNRNDSVRDFGN